MDSFAAKRREAHTLGNNSDNASQPSGGTALARTPPAPDWQPGNAPGNPGVVHTQPDPDLPSQPELPSDPLPMARFMLTPPPEQGDGLEFRTMPAPDWQPGGAPGNPGLVHTQPAPDLPSPSGLPFDPSPMPRFFVTPAPMPGDLAIFHTMPSPVYSTLPVPVTRPLPAPVDGAEVTPSVHETASTEAPPTDDLFDLQWHFDWLGDIQKIWEEFTGEGVHVGVFDDGVLTTHEDLEANYDWSLSVTDFLGNIYDPNPTVLSGSYYGANHGTAVSGLIAAARNGIGTVGVAYEAGITVVDILSGYGEADINVNPYTFFEAAMTLNFDVINHSWGNGSYFYQASHYPEAADLDFLTTYAWETARDFGREETFADGSTAALGTIQVKAAGNEGLNANGVSSQSSRSTIIVGAYNDGESVSYYSNYGANLLVSAPSSGRGDHAGQVTTDLPVLGGTDYGYNGLDDPAYTNSFGGTSGAAPIVTGVVALMLDANEHLGWRDVQNILAYSAHEVGSGVGHAMSGYEYFEWQYNGADNWNGGGLHFSNDYGYGGVDAYNAVRMAEVWSLFGAPKASANESSYSQSWYEPIELEDAMMTDVIFTFGGDPFAVDVVDITVTLSHAALSDLEITLISPNGTEISLLDFSIQSYDNEEYGWTWTFGANAFRGEEGTGEWTLRFTDTWAIDSGTLDNVELKLHGTDGASSDLTSDVYHYTSEVFESLSRDASRLTLTDSDGGEDWINAATLADDLVIRLEEGASSTAGGTEFVRIAAGTLIENAVTGDGDDELHGNDLDNKLYGMRGDDVLLGGAGGDTLAGGAGNDTLTGGLGADMFLFDRALDASGNVDIIVDFSHLDDVIWLDVSIFEGLSLGALDAEYFYVIGSGVEDADDRILFDATLGALYFDVDGAGGEDAVQFATLEGSIELSFEDFVVVTAVPDAPEYVDDRWEPANPVEVTSVPSPGIETYDTELIVGTIAADQILIKDGDTLNHKIFGLDGSDVLVGGGGDDYIDGGQNNDIIWGGSGNDWLIGGGSDINIYGGPLLTAAGEEIYGGYGNDFIQGSNQQNDWTYKNAGLHGDDQLNGGQGDDIIYGLDGDDFLIGDDFFDPETGINNIAGGNDVLYGGGGSDYLMGGSGDDRIYAGTGYRNEVVGDWDAGIPGYSGGIDTLVFENSFEDYHFAASTLDPSVLIASRTTAGDVENTYFHSDIEFLEFQDRTLNLTEHSLIYYFNRGQSEHTPGFPDLDLEFFGYEVAAYIGEAGDVSIIDNGAETGSVDRLQTVELREILGDATISSDALEFIRIGGLDSGADGFHGSITVDNAGGVERALELSLTGIQLDAGERISDDTATEIIMKTSGKANKGVFANGAGGDDYNLSFEAAESIRWKLNDGDVFVKWKIPNVTTIDMTYTWPEVLGQDDNTGGGNYYTIAIETALDDEVLATAGGSAAYEFIGTGSTFVRFGNLGAVNASNDGTLGDDQDMNAGLGLAGHITLGAGSIGSVNFSGREDGRDVSIARILGTDAFQGGTVDGSGTAMLRMTFAVGEAIGDISDSIENFRSVQFDVTSLGGTVDVDNFDDLDIVAVGGYLGDAGESTVLLQDSSSVMIRSVGDATHFGTVNLLGTSSELTLSFVALWNESFDFAGNGEEFDVGNQPAPQIADGTIHVADAETLTIWTNSRSDYEQLPNGLRPDYPAFDSFAQVLDLDAATSITLRGDTGWDFTVAGTDISHVTTLDARNVTGTGSVGAVTVFAQTDDAVSFTGGRGDDIFAGGAGNDAFDGRQGFDTVMFSGVRSDYSLEFVNGAWVVTDNRLDAPDGVDTLKNIERITFSDGTSIGTGADLTGAPGDILASADQVAENSANGTVVATLSTIDPDSADTDFTYSIVNSTGAFAIDGDKIVVADTLAFDYEGAGLVYSDDGVYRIKVTVRSTDSSGQYVDKQLSFWVTDVNPEHVIGDDRDNLIWGGDGADYIDGGAGNDRIFGEEGNNILIGGAGDDSIKANEYGGESTVFYTGNRADYDLERSGWATQTDAFVITDTVADRDGTDSVSGVKYIHFADGTFLVSELLALTDNSAPTDILPDTAEIAENSANGTVVAELSAVDPDDDETFTYELVDDAGGRFAIVDGKLVVADATGLDYEAATEHTVTVKVTDSAGNTLEEDIVVGVTDVVENAAPTDISLSSAEVAELSASDTVVGTLTASDPDTGETFTYELTDDAGGRFAIDGDTIVVADSAALDFESDASHDVTVKVTDSGGLTHEKTFTIDVTDVNETPVVSLENVTASLKDDVSTSQPIKVADIVIHDDAIGVNRLSVTGRDAALFEIIGMALFLQAGVVLDAAQAADLQVAVAVDDDDIAGTPDAVSTTVTLVVEDADALNQIEGTPGSEIINGTSGNDHIDGQGGSDAMHGGDGDDTYIVDDYGDTVHENPNEGIDTVVASGNHVLGENFENVTLTGNASFADGNELDNVIIGNDADNVLSGLGGDDYIDGGAGADQMFGGTGNDTYVVDSYDDVVVEHVNEGNDSVITHLNHVLEANVENITLTGETSSFADGNALDNVIIGNAGDNVLSGLDGDDYIDGGAGADQMFGGTGNDTYVVDNAGDVIGESADQGTDTVEASVNYALGNNLENLTLTGSAAIDGTGNALGNTITGNAAANVLSGGAGADTFVFNTALGSGNVDTLSDFEAGVDMIHLDQGIFAGLGAGALAASAFAFGTAGDGDDRIIYDQDSGALYFDIDGSGEGAQVQFAQLDAGLGMTHSDFFVV
jgi:Ca2+-binding RTX toxin-like protein